MMKSKVKEKKDNFVAPVDKNDPNSKKKEPPVELMQRLAMGQRA